MTKVVGFSQMGILLSLLAASVAMANGTRVVSISKRAFSGAPVNSYLEVEDLLVSDEAKAACPNGISKITRFRAEIVADFNVQDLETQAQTYPMVKLVAAVICR